MTDSVVIERTLDANQELVWNMWTDPAHFAAWYGPMGASIPTADMEVHPGGKRHICMAMETPDGPMEMWFVGEFVEIDPHDRLVYTEAMSDADGNVIDPAQMGMPGDHPATTRVIVELEAMGERTKLKLTHEGVPADSPGAQGWTMAVDKLAGYLADQD